MKSKNRCVDNTIQVTAFFFFFPFIPNHIYNFFFPSGSPCQIYDIVYEVTNFCPTNQEFVDNVTIYELIQLLPLI